MHFDALLLSRAPFAFTIAFHLIFATFTVGLASFLAVLEGLWLATRSELFRTLYLFWIEIFAVAFCLGAVAAGVTAYEPGTDRSVVAALFLEAGLLAVMLFGWRRAGRSAHFAASVLIAIGALASAVWMVPAAGWMRDSGVPGRLVHVGLAACLATALLVGAASAWRLLNAPEEDESCIALKMAIGMFVIAAPLQLVAADMSAPQPMGVLAVAAARVHAVWASPVIAGLDLATIALGLWGAFHVWRGHLARARAFLFACVAMGWAGVLGLAGSQDAWRFGGLAGASGAASQASGDQAPLVAAGFAIYAVACGLGGFHVLRLIGRGPALRSAAESL